MTSILKLSFWVYVVLIFALLGCQQEESSPPPNSGFVEANEAYLKNFGSPPQGKAGEAFARVGYLPLRETPEKVSAFPLFLFSGKEQQRQILNRLISGELVLTQESGFFNPFPADLEVTIQPQDNSILTLILKTGQSWSASDQTAAGRALAETALQSKEVETVLIMLNDEPFVSMPRRGYQHEPALVVEVKPPNLVLMAGMWEKGTDNLEELLVEFDRPIKVNNFKLYDETDNLVDGDYFTSIFQMAVAILPKDPDKYQEGTVLKAEWDVVDDLGRSNKGVSRLPLLRFDH